MIPLFSRGAAFIEQSLQLLKEHSEETYAHSVRVGALAARIASASGMDDKRIELLRVCGFMHDIGKLMVPKEILMKQSELTAAEFKQIRVHPMEGYGMARQYLSASVANAVLFHHERWDGKGYPFGLLYDAIPMEARIVALADCYDAMTVQRTYKPALSSADALIELRTLYKQYDPGLVEILERIVWT